MDGLLVVQEGMYTPVKEIKTPKDTEKREARHSQPSCSVMPFGKFSLGSMTGSRCVCENRGKRSNVLPLQYFHLEGISQV